jgi:hypothetical protein
MPRPPTVHDTPLEKEFVCAQCNGKFRSNAGRTRHINAKHSDSVLQMNSKSPQSEEAGHFSDSDISSCPGFPSPTSTPLGNIFDSPSRNSDTFNFDTDRENDFNFSNHDGNMDNTPPLSPLQDTASTSTEYHPYINGKMNNL